MLRFGEEDSGSSARGEEDCGVPRGRPCRGWLVPGARRPPTEGLHHTQRQGPGLRSVPAQGTVPLHQRTGTMMITEICYRSGRGGGSSPEAKAWAMRSTCPRNSSSTPKNRYDDDYIQCERMSGVFS